MVGGSGPLDVDFARAVYGRFPLMLGIIAAVTFLLLARAFRSLLLPAKAVLLNLLSVGAIYGVLKLVWQDGHGSGLWGIPATGSVDTFIPVMVFAFLYGLSMDYEVFILARMREAHDRTGSTTTAIVEGIGRTGRLVTSAALILFLAFASLAAGPETTLKVFATGLGAGILLAAIVVRALLVPPGQPVRPLELVAARLGCPTRGRAPIRRPTSASSRPAARRPARACLHPAVSRTLPGAGRHPRRPGELPACHISRLRSSDRMTWFPSAASAVRPGSPRRRGTTKPRRGPRWGRRARHEAAPVRARVPHRGLAVVAIDHRHFGASDGQPRQLLSVRRQPKTWTRRWRWWHPTPALDARRVALWGTYFAASHVLPQHATPSSPPCKCPIVRGRHPALVSG